MLLCRQKLMGLKHRVRKRGKQIGIEIKGAKQERKKKREREMENVVVCTFVRGKHDVTQPTRARMQAPRHSTAPRCISFSLLFPPSASTLIKTTCPHISCDCVLRTITWCQSRGAFFFWEPLSQARTTIGARCRRDSPHRRWTGKHLTYPMLWLPLATLLDHRVKSMRTWTLTSMFTPFSLHVAFCSLSKWRLVLYALCLTRVC